MLARWTCLILLLMLSACATGAPRPTLCAQTGLASWYRPRLHRTADGDRNGSDALIAAHRTLPFGVRVRVTDLDSGRSVIVRIDDRGPFIRGRIIDLSPAAAKRLGMRRDGVAKVRLDFPNARGRGGACPFSVAGKA